LPFSVPAESVKIDDGRIDQVWQAVGPVSGDFRMSAEGSFGERGLSLTIENSTPAEVVAPVLVWGKSAYRLPAIAAAGPTAVALGPADRNPPGQYANTGTVVTDADKQRGMILSSLMVPSGGSSVASGTGTGGPIVAGWVDDAQAPRLIEPSAAPAVRQAQVLVRFPVTLKPSPVGSAVAIDAGFNALTFGPDLGLPYDLGQGEWIPSAQPGEWLVGFTPPREAGKLKVTRATLDVSLNLPAQTLTIRRGQVRGGQPRRNPSGEVLATYQPTFGRQPPVVFDTGDNDVDGHGRVWLLVTVENPPPGASPQVSPWNFTEFGVALDATVVGPPRPPAAPVSHDAGKKTSDDQDEQ
jgi:hypothetical protein